MTLPSLRPVERSTAPLLWPWSAFWPQIQVRLQGRAPFLLAFDFEGVIASKSPDPAEAALDAGLRSLLLRLLASPRLFLSVISGRSLPDLEARLALPGLISAGNYGMEIRGAGLTMSDGLASSCRSDLVDAVAFLTRFSRRMAGVAVEDKGLSITVHWRQASAETRRALEDLLAITIRSHPRLQVFAGEMAWNIRARASWNKSNALAQILDHLGLPPSQLIYLADASTEESTFAPLGDSLIFRVGSLAAAPPPLGYTVASRQEVPALVSRVLAALESGSPGESPLS